MILYLNTSSFDGLELALVGKEQLIDQTAQTLEYNENYKTLEIIETFFKKNKVEVENIKSIF